MTTAPIDTKTARRRLVAYASFADLLGDLSRIERSYAASTLTPLGNRAPGPMLGHLAISMRGSFDGIPELRNAAPMLLRLVGPFVKRRVLRAPLRPGVRMSSQAQSALWDDATTVETGLAELRTQIDRMDRPDARPTAAHPVFGRLSPEEWKVFHLRHAELHLSFLQL